MTDSRRPPKTTLPSQRSDPPSSIPDYLPLESYKSAFSPVFLEEFSNSVFYYSSSKRNTRKEVNYKLPPSEVVDILVGCYEQIENLPEVIEYIIQACDIQKEEIIKMIDASFNNYVTFAEMRLSVNKQIIKFNNCFFDFVREAVEQDVTPINSDSFVGYFMNLSKYRQVGMDIRPNLFPIMEFYRNLLPPTSLTPPSKNFLMTGVGTSETFSSTRVNSLGTSSNGKFLFVLCLQGFIQCFPLINYGALLPKTSKKLPFDSPEMASLVALKEKICVFTEEKVYEFDINTFLRPDGKPLAVSEFVLPPKYSKKCIGHVSNGSIMVHIGRFENNNTINCDCINIETKEEWSIKLTKGISKPKDVIPFPLPEGNLDKIPIEVSGTCIGFHFRVSPNEVILRSFSLIDGKFLYDESYECEDILFSISLDSINRCHWAITTEKNQFLVKKYAYIGSISPQYLFLPNPEKVTTETYEFSISDYINPLYHSVFHSIGSHVVPPTLIPSSKEMVLSIVDSCIHILEPKCYLSNQDKEKVFIIAAALIDNHIRSSKSTTDTETIDKIHELAFVLPYNISIFLFFNSFPALFKDLKSERVDTMVKLVAKCQQPSLLSFIHKKIEKSSLLAYIPLTSSSTLRALMPNNAIQSSSISDSSLMLLLTQQRVLFTVTQTFIEKSDPPVVVFDLQLVEGKKTPLHYFYDYSLMVFNSYLSALSFSRDPNELISSLASLLFNNYLRLLSPLTEIHCISQMLISLFHSSSMKILNSVFINNSISQVSNENRTAILFIFTFGKLCSTLIQGGTLSSVEKNSPWLIRSNLRISQNDYIFAEEFLENEELDDIGQQYFITKDNGIMDIIYKKFKPQLNRNLQADIKVMDKKFLIAICKHTRCLNELFEFTAEHNRSDKFNEALDMMMKLRNNYREINRKIKQNDANIEGSSLEELEKGRKSLELLKQKTMMLIRMEPDSDYEVSAKDVERLLSSDETPRSFLYAISIQAIRNKLTLLGFLYVDSLFSQINNPFIASVLSHAFGQIEDFQNLNSILKISGLKEGFSDVMVSFFRRSAYIAEMTNSSVLLLMSFRFFKDILVEKSLKSAVLDLMIEKFLSSKMRLPFFALSLSLIKGAQDIPTNLIDLKSKDALRWLLVSELFASCSPSHQFYNFFVDFFWACEPREKKYLYRVLFHVLNSPNIDDNLIDMAFLRIYNFIGEMMVAQTNLDTAYELIWLLRRVLIDGTSNRKSNLSGILLSTPLVAKDDAISGLFAVIGSYIEPFRAFCTVRYHHSKSNVCDYIAIPSKEGLKFNFYPKPFKLNNEPMPVDSTDTHVFYPIPVLTLPPTLFPHFQFIYDFAERCFTDIASIPALNYMQAISHFMQNGEFAKNLPERIIREIYSFPIPMSTIPKDYQMTSILMNKTIKESLGVFSALLSQKSKYVSHISSPIHPNSEWFSITVKFSSPKASGYIGIVSNSSEVVNTRYSLFEYPAGIHHPSRTSYSQLPSIHGIQCFINYKQKFFQIGNFKFQFPMGSSFRFIIVHPIDINIQIDTSVDPQSLFCSEIPPDIPQKGALFCNNNKFLYDVNDSLVENPNQFPAELSQFPDLPPIPQAPFEFKISNMLSKTPENIIIHPILSEKASYMIINEFIRGLHQKLSRQLSTIAILRHIIHGYEISDPQILIRVFIIFITTLELYIPSKLVDGKIPFSLTEPIWQMSTDTNGVYMNLESEIKESLAKITQMKVLPSLISSYLINSVNSEYLHIGSSPNHYHVYIPPNSIPPNQFRLHFKTGIVTFNNILIKTIEPMINGTMPMPLIVRSGPVNIDFSPIAVTKEISLFEMNENDNSWIFDTPYELILAMKALLFLKPNNEEKLLLKIVIMDMFSAQSPLILPFIPDLLLFIQSKVPPSPIGYSRKYLKSLFRYGMTLKTYRSIGYDKCLSFLGRETSVILSPYCKLLSGYFPEFFGLSNNNALPNDSVSIPGRIVDIGAMQTGFDECIKSIFLASSDSSSIEGFPFWEIFGLWLRVTNNWPVKNDPILPFYIRVGDDMLRFDNPSRLRYELQFNFTCSLSNDAMIVFDTVPSFISPNYIMRDAFTQKITIGSPKIFFRINSVASYWNECQVNIVPSPSDIEASKKSIAPRNINIIPLREAFINDMKEFVQWKVEHTAHIRMTIPRYVLESPLYQAVLDFCDKECSLKGQFSTNVLALRVLMFQQFNFIRLTKKQAVPESTWASLQSYISIEESAESILAVVKGQRVTPQNKSNLPLFKLDRHKAQRRILDRSGSPTDSIISQFASQFKEPDDIKLRFQDTIWKISFVGEAAIDAGGPMREALTEATTSIFEASTELSIPVPNGMRKEGPNREYFIPYTESSISRNTDYTAIGILLGIIMRSGFVQDIPFAPLVWKYLSKEKLSTIDIFDIDKQFADHISHMRESKNLTDYSKLGFEWKTNTWTGASVQLPGHPTGTLVDSNQIELYVAQCTTYKLQMIQPYLKLMRKGFQANIGFKKHPLLNGPLLARVLQGTSGISVQHMKDVTKVVDYEGPDDPHIQRYWAAVERLNSEQLRLLLKFQTTLTRLPNTSVQKDFRLKIDKLGCRTPDQSLPTASTCFYALHLPPYSTEEICYQKLVYAITYCQTMENS